MKMNIVTYYDVTSDCFIMLKAPLGRRAGHAKVFGSVGRQIGVTKMGMYSFLAFQIPMRSWGVTSVIVLNHSWPLLHIINYRIFGTWDPATVNYLNGPSSKHFDRAFIPVLPNCRGRWFPPFLVVVYGTCIIQWCPFFLETQDSDVKARYPQSSWWVLSSHSGNTYRYIEPPRKDYVGSSS